MWKLLVSNRAKEGFVLLGFGVYRIYVASGPCQHYKTNEFIKGRTLTKNAVCNNGEPDVNRYPQRGHMSV